jgi:uncharacterized protein (TIGR02466 family)
MKLMTQTLFPIPIGISEREQLITEREFEFVKNAEYRNNTLNSAGQKYNIFENAELKNIADFCKKSLDAYVSLHYKVSTKFDIHISWANKTSPGQSHHKHNHANSIFSGVFYFQDLDIAPIRFWNPNEVTSFDIRNNQEYSEWNEFNSPCWAMDHIKANTCIIFPSWLYHDVGENSGDKDRYSIAFNCYFAPNQIVGMNATMMKA